MASLPSPFTQARGLGVLVMRTLKCLKHCLKMVSAIQKLSLIHSQYGFGDGVTGPQILQMVSKPEAAFPLVRSGT